MVCQAGSEIVDKAPLISVILTTYNRAAKLERALSSVLHQDYPALELVVVDDGSTDGTSSLMESRRAKSPQVKYVRHLQNRGNAAARNTGVDAASGRYIAFMDDDDEWIDPKKLAKQIRVLGGAGRQLGLVATSVNLVDSAGKSVRKPITKPRDLRAWLLRRNGIIYSPTVLTSKSIILEAGMFDTNISRGVDSTFYRTVVLDLGYDIEIMPDVTTNIYESGDDRMSSNIGTEQLRRSFQSELYTVRKFVRHYVRYPGALVSRLRSLSKTLLKIALTR